MKNKVYSFSTDDAIAHGVDEAILLHNIRYWIDYARAHDEMKQDGYYWMFMTASKMQTIMPFWSSNKIQKMLKKLTEKGVLLTGEYNKSSWNRTKWYTMPEFKHSAKMINGASQTDGSTFSQTADSLYDQYKDSNNGKPNSKIDYSKIESIYKECLPSAPVLSKITDTRKKLIIKFFNDFDMNYEKLENYFRFLSSNESFKWLFESRPMNNGTNAKWQKKKIEYFLSEKCYLAAKEYEE